jgi:hypothetical protein
MVLASVDAGSGSFGRIIRDRHLYDWSVRP